ncbi:response regulator [Bacteroidota bacterium]|jgi:DNA-binding NtrC family response regulator
MEDKLYIMIIDDENIVGKRLKPALEKRGDIVETFVDSRKALQRFDEKNFDIVITDIRMDDIDGLEVLEHVTSHSKQTKVIMITGYATVEVARQALAKGAFDFIAKPFKPNDLRTIIEKAANQLRTEKAN